MHEHKFGESNSRSDWSFTILLFILRWMCTIRLKNMKLFIRQQASRLYQLCVARANWIRAIESVLVLKAALSWAQGESFHLRESLECWFCYRCNLVGMSYFYFGQTVFLCPFQYAMSIMNYSRFELKCQLPWDIIETFFLWLREFWLIVCRLQSYSKEEIL